MRNRMKDFPEQRHVIEKTTKTEMKILRGLVLGIDITLLCVSNLLPAIDLPFT